MKMRIKVVLSGLLVSTLVYGGAEAPNINRENAKRLQNIDEANSTTLLVERYDRIAWKEPVIIMAEPPNAEDTFKTGAEVRKMFPIQVGNRVIRCSLNGKAPDSDKKLEQNAREGLKVEVLAVRSTVPGRAAFEWLDDRRNPDDSKRMVCVFYTLINGKKNTDLRFEPKLSRAELLAYFQAQNELQIKRQLQDDRLRAEYIQNRDERDKARAKAIEDKMKKEGKSIERVLIEMIQKPSHNGTSSEIFDRLHDERNVHREYRDKFRYPLYIHEIFPSEKQQTEEEAKKAAEEEAAKKKAEEKKNEAILF